MISISEKFFFLNKLSLKCRISNRNVTFIFNFNLFSQGFLLMEFDKYDTIV